LICFGLPLYGGSLGPEWWTTKGVFIAGAAPSDFSMVSQGQLKQMAFAAMQHLDDNSSSWDTNQQIHNLVNSWTTNTAGASDFSPATIGQLKAIASMFYTRLSTMGYSVAGALKTYGYPSTWSYNTPWDPNSATNDYASFNIGQLKMAFCFEVNSTSDSNFLGIFDPGTISARNFHLIGTLSQTTELSTSDATLFGFQNGAYMFSTGTTDWKGANTSENTSFQLGLPGDADLQAAAFGNVTSTYDASGLEFQFKPTYSNVSIDIVFASEEYLEYVGQFDDTMAIFVDGVAISKTPDGKDVGVGSINSQSNSSLYKDNPVNGNVYNTIFDGFTAKLTFSVTCDPTKWHSIKIVVADANDEALDSGMFVGKASLRSSQ